MTSEPACPHAQRSRASAPSLWLALIALAMALMAGLAAPAFGAGTPDIGLSKETPGDLLYGADAAVTLTASNPLGEPYGYNVSFRDVLPAGVSYVANSSPAGDPIQIADQPNPNETTLIWPNVADLSANSSYALSYQVRHSTSSLLVGDSYTNSAGAYLNDDPRWIPDFDLVANDGLFESGGDDDGDGLPISGAASYTGSATATADTDLVPFELEISEPNAEGEILRGLHDHQTVYTFEIRNNLVNATNGFSSDAWFPAGLEFLGCGLSDNTGDAPTNAGSPDEYAGAGPINPGNAPLPTTNPCPVSISTIETVQIDPDGPGPLPNAVYTHVVFSSLGNLPANGIGRWDVIAAIPIRENTLDWNGATAGLGTPAATTGLQTANLDNNSGPETDDEQDLTVYGVASGSYTGPIASPGVNPLTDDHSLTRVAEDLSVHKTGSDVSLDQGEITTWTLLIETSEYRYVDNVRVTDTVPDGYCPLGTTNLEETLPASNTECDAVTGVGPTLNGGAANSAPYKVAGGETHENADGTWDVFWDQTTVTELTRIQPSSRVTIAFPTRTRAFYQQNFADASPVLANDSASNTVDIAGQDYITCENGDTDCTGAGTKINADEADGVDDLDASSAGQDAAGPVIDKKVSTPVAAPTILNCSTATYIEPLASTYTPGDRVCWKLRIDFPGSLDTEHQTVNDFLPAGSAYEAGSWVATAANTVTIPPTGFGENGSALSWDVVTADTGGQVFEIVFSTLIDDPSAAQDGDVLGNLMKYASQNTAGVSFPLRDQVDFTWAEPQLTLLKGVQDVNGVPAIPNPANTDGATVRANDVVTYRVDVINSGTRDAVNTEVWDRLPSQITTCASVDVLGISDLGTCDDSGAPVIITWTSLTVGASSTKTLTYDLTVHSTIGADERLDNTAGVRGYEAVTNTGTNFPYVPASNIDPAHPDTPNTDAADDDSYVEALDATTVKTTTTQINQSGNNTSSEATIGEEITYTVTLTIPEGTSLYSGVLTDPLSSKHTYVSGSAAVTLPGGGSIIGDSGSSGSFTFDTASNTIALTFPTAYTNLPGTSDDVVTIVFKTRVDDEATNDRNDQIPNVATLGWDDSTGGGQTNAGSRTLRIVEPNVALSKTNDATGPVAPNDVVTFTVTATNQSGTRVSTANDVEVKDVVPTGLSVNVASISGSGTYDGPSRTITWNISTLAPGASTPLTYTATLNTGVAGQASLTNLAAMTTTSLPAPADADGERTAASAAGHAPPIPGYAASAQSTLTVVAATIGKTVVPTTRTIGELSTYTVTTTIPANVDLFDTTVVDTLPDGLTFASYGVAGTADCASPASTGTTTPLTPVVNAGGSTAIAWYLGDIPGCATQRVVTLVYTATVDATYTTGGANVDDADVLKNAANLAWNFTNLENDTTVRTGGTIPAGPFSTTTADAVADLTVAEPSLTIDKDVSGQTGDTDAREAEPGSSFTYTIVVTNDGTSPAYDITIDDLPDVELENVVPVAGAGFVTDGWTALDPDIIWTIPGPIAPSGGTVTLTYTADLVASAGLADGQTAVNTASVPLYHGVDTDSPPPGAFRAYTEDPSDVVTVTVDLPELTIAKTTGGTGFPERADAELLQPFTWRVVVSNTATTATAYDVDVSDVLPPNWTYVANSASFAPGGANEPSITLAPTGDTLAWTDAGDIAPGGNITLTFQAAPQLASATNPGSGSGNPHTNTASSTADDASGASGSASGPYAAGPDTATAILQVPVLGIAKTPDGGVAVAGAPSQFTITIANTGTAPARNVVVTDVLPPGIDYTASDASALPAAGFSEASVTPDSPGPGQTTIVWNISQVAVGNTVITLPVALDSPLVNGTTLTNTASFVSDEDPTGSSDTGSLVVGSAPVWLTASTKAATPAAATPVAPGSTITYAIHAENTGNENATTVVVTDATPTDSTYVAASVSSTPAVTADFLVGGSYQATEPADPADVQGIRWAVGTLNVGQSSELGFQVTVDLPLPDGTSITNAAQLTSDQTPTATTLGPISHPVTSSPLLTLTKSVDDTALELNTEGTALSYGLVLTNTGDETANNVEITDGPPPGTTVTGITAGGATVECSIDADPGPYTYGACPPTLETVTQIRWSAATVAAPSGSLTVGLDVDVTVPATTGVADGTIIPNTASAISDETTPAPSTSVSTTLTTSPILGLTKSVAPTGLVAPGATLTYSLDYSSTGSLPAQGVVVADAIPANTTYVAASASAGAEFLVGGTYQATEPSDPTTVEGLRWDLGDLAIGDAGTLTFDVTAGAILDDALTLTNTATATATNHADVSSSVVSEIDSAAALTITKETSTVQAELGEQVSYAITVTVSGNANADPLIVSDALPAELAFLSATDGGSIADGVVTWNLGTTAPGSTKQVFVIASVVGGSTQGQSVVNIAQVTGGNNAAAGRAFTDDAAFVALSGEPCARGGSVEVSTSRVLVGVQSEVTVRVTNPDGSPAANAEVVLRGKGVRGKVRATTNANGEAVISFVAAKASNKLTVEVAACETTNVLAAVRSTTCAGIQVDPETLAVGVRNRARIVVTSGGLPVQKQRIVLRGPGIRIKAKTSKKGIVRVRLKPTRAGVVRITVPRALKCQHRVGAADGLLGSHLTG